MTRHIVFANRKGGCAKTTTAVNVAHSLALKNYRVLLMDLDPQAHATLSLGMVPNPGVPNIYTLLDGGANLEDVIYPSRIANLSIIPSSRNLSVVEIEGPCFSADEHRLSEVLHSKKMDMDYVIMDPPPSVGTLSVNALAASEEVYIPMPMHFLAMEGLAEMVRLIYQINAAWNPGLSLGGIIPTFYNKNTRITKEIEGDIVQTFGEKFLAPPIRQNVALAEAPGHGLTIFEYAPKSIGALDYDALASFIDERH
ncbi:MAG: ParA family protein [Desulfamplus sp.]|nr:ParA family protein [Desulfamplus sp.]